MTDPERERIEALIENLDTICGKMKAAGLGRYVGRVHDAIAQLRADHPARGWRVPGISEIEHWKARAVKLEKEVFRLSGVVMAPDVHVAVSPEAVDEVITQMPPPAPAKTEATPAEQGGGGATAAAGLRRMAEEHEVGNALVGVDLEPDAASRLSFTEQDDAVERAAEHHRQVAEHLREIGVTQATNNTADSQAASALSAAAATLAAVPAVVEALTALFSNAKLFNRDSDADWVVVRDMVSAALRALVGEDRK